MLGGRIVACKRDGPFGAASPSGPPRFQGKCRRGVNAVSVLGIPMVVTGPAKK